MGCTYGFRDSVRVHQCGGSRRPGPDNGVTGLSRVSIDHLVANYYHTDEAKEMGRAFNSKQDPDPDKFYR